MYKITAQLKKPGGLPVNWTRYSENELTKEYCQSAFQQYTEKGVPTGDPVTIYDFTCEKVMQSRVSDRA